MRLEQHYAASPSKLMRDYINGEHTIRRYFSYEPLQSQFDVRLEKLRTHAADREKLSAIIRSFMEPNGISEAAAVHLNDFENGAPVVVTGQQAGLLSGPLYTVHKAISVIVLAQQASEQLKTKVVPVFWIAGEDHDLAEISHLYREVNHRVDKLNFPHAEYGKNSASTAVLNKEKVRSFLEEYFRSLPETEHSRNLHQLVFSYLDKASTFTDFFSAILNYFFHEEGLLYIDAAYPQLRQYESPYFVQMIERSEEIAASVYETEQALTQDGYSAVIGAEKNAANLFVAVKGERILLQREGRKFSGNNGAISFTYEELMDIAKTAPERLSNNVVTRPIMQEMVFPVLAFVGGPGEIAYWAAFKGAFSLLEMEMPVVMPRLNMTLITRQTEALLKKYRLTVMDVINEKKITALKTELEDAIREKKAELLIDKLKEKLEAEYTEINEQFTQVSRGLAPIVEKNLQIHLKQLTFLKHKLQDEVMLQHSTQFNHYAFIENELLPNNGFQERVYNPFPYLNLYGLDLVKDILKLRISYDKNHKIIYL
ncbi:bacillithiol biosynthesis cysteine-adding enzyme BshC [Planomicrobium sp. CPCC 101079]|uniref:bacillithiol biosynthesis cysteine-adding enzyme BshC n=1 Tax=Planomicrobium sp. CPCC 101079 TaxID=2599618 RepID=UPI0011B4A457|nr:bacillithiol biosynthesis cysteine-adding enzyme BshC [Planomicrobium sp. CPCC 101079]TWT04724.1 bacillithiol biosynthesis cysteine-adding enzyme BshC [Planomicrobium sp. CPCC 101079]